MMFCHQRFQVGFTAESIAPEVSSSIPPSLVRDSPYLTHPIFSMYVYSQNFASFASVILFIYFQTKALHTEHELH